MGLNSRHISSVGSSYMYLPQALSLWSSYLTTSPTTSPSNRRGDRQTREPNWNCIGPLEYTYVKTVYIVSVQHHSEQYVRSSPNSAQSRTNISTRSQTGKRGAAAYTDRVESCKSIGCCNAWFACLPWSRVN